MLCPAVNDALRVIVNQMPPIQSTSEGGLTWAPLPVSFRDGETTTHLALHFTLDDDTTMEIGYNASLFQPETVQPVSCQAS